LRAVLYLPEAAASRDPYSLSLPDALPIYRSHRAERRIVQSPVYVGCLLRHLRPRGSERLQREDTRGRHRRVQFFPPRHHGISSRSEEHTSELQSRENLVCRLLPEKKTISR